MTQETFNKRIKAAGYKTYGKAYEFAMEVMWGQKARPAYYSGSGRYTRLSDYTWDTDILLRAAGLTHSDFTTGNDAPRGGSIGNFIQLTAKGRRKMIK